MVVMSALNRCYVCGDEIERGRGEPCMVCGAWFHYAQKEPAARRCGLSACDVPGLDA
jgi:hypothetical protein